jgi:hypothetical protein
LISVGRHALAGQAQPGNRQKIAKGEYFCV